MRSSFIDSLKLAFSDDYEIPDDSYLKLSGILIKNGLTEDVFDLGLIKLIKVILRNRLEFPISINLLQKYWDVDGKAFNFVHTLVPLVKWGYIKLKRLDRDKALSNGVILGEFERDESIDSYVVVYSTDKLDEVLSVFSEVLSQYSNEYSADDDEILESVNPRNLPSWANRTLDLIHQGLRNYDIDAKVYFESFIPDEAVGRAEIGIVVTGADFDQVNKGIVPRNLKKNLRQENSIGVSDGYVDGNNDLYISLTVPLNFKAFKRLAEGILNTIKDLGGTYA